ncbi:hypothetical protein J4219_07075 [Candidatus Woesearchaeota archaeon]|nr:hypothetical protein [Candidatus Woesearchaeota archaeon]
MKKAEFIETITQMKKYRAAYLRLYELHSPIRDFLNDVKKEYQSYDDADWKMPGSEAALDSSVKKRTLELLASQKDTDIAKILQPYDICSLRVEGGYEVLPINAPSRQFGSYGLPGSVFLERLLETQESYAKLRSASADELDLIASGMTKSFNYSCGCHYKTPCKNCKTVHVLEAFTTAADTAKSMLNYFYKQKSKTLEREYPIIEWDRGVSADLKFDFDWLKDKSPYDTLKLLCPKDRELLTLTQLTCKRDSGFVKITANLSDERQVSELYSLLEAVKEWKYTREDAYELRTELTRLLELEHLEQYLSGFNSRKPPKYASRGEDAKTKGIVDGIESLMKQAVCTREDLADQIKKRKVQLREKYGILDLNFCCEDKEYNDGPSMFPRKPQGSIRFYEKTMTSLNDMGLIKLAKDHVLSMIH